MATRKQAAASRENGLKGGVRTERGKAISRLNARKHGIFVTALTAEDAEEVYGVEDELIASLRPVGRVEEMLVEKLALTYLRMQRCARTEAEFHAQTWEEPNPVHEERRWEWLQADRRCGGRGVAFRTDLFERMVKLIDLYDARLTNQFLKLLHEIERLQRRRAGEDVPPPVVADVTVQTDAGDVCSAPAEVSQEAPDAAPDGATTNAQTSAPVPHTPAVESDLTVQDDAAEGPVLRSLPATTEGGEGREMESAAQGEAVPPAPEQSPGAASPAEAAQVTT